MADVTMSLSIVASKSGAYVTTNTSGTSFTYTMTGSDMISGTYTLTAGYVTLDKGAITTIGKMSVRNLSATTTDYCSVSIDGTNEAFRVYGGDAPCLIDLRSATSPKVKTNGTLNDIFYVMVEA
jgi:asparagine N-glycosylation enzyme membrane subunit Stt3